MRHRPIITAHTSTKRACCFLSIIILTSAALTGCGGHSSASGHSGQYLVRKVAPEEVEKVLKFDSRVQDFETDGTKLIINVDEVWASSTPGVKQFSLGVWFNQWKTANEEGARGVEVLVRHDGVDLARATQERGIEFIESKGSATQDH